MGVHRHGGTPEGAVTPICNECGVSLCWDLSDFEYAEAKPFWDRWICQECNGGTKMSLKAWHAQNPDYVPELVDVPPMSKEEAREFLASLTEEDKAFLLETMRKPPDPNEAIKALMTRPTPWEIQEASA